MTDAAQIAALADRVEKLDGPDVGVDWDIEWALGEWINLGGWWREHKKTGDREQFSPSMGAAAYTASLDAAVTMVPEGWEGEITLHGHVELMRSRIRGPVVEGNAATPALALVAAALRAHASQEPSDGE